jgi:hypothetical protein
VCSGMGGKEEGKKTESMQGSVGSGAGLMKDGRRTGTGHWRLLDKCMGGCLIAWRTWSQAARWLCNLIPLHDGQRRHRPTTAP